MLGESIKSGLKEDVIYKALLSRGEDQQELFRLARESRGEFFPHDEVEVRSVIEISNICKQKCRFCGMNFHSKRKRYIISHKNLIEITENIYSRGRRVLFLQSGENRSQKYIDFISRCLEDIKKKFDDLTIILCLGELSFHQYRQLRGAGADRYILKFETSNPVLYGKIKPDDSLEARVECIQGLTELGFGVGSGNIIGLPGQTVQDIVSDLLFLSKFSLSMTSTTVFIPGEDSDYRSEPMGDVDTVLNFMALMRIMYPKVLVPTTSSLEKARKGGQYLGLEAGANTVTVHDGTPAEMKKHFPIYSVNRFTPNEEYMRDIVAKARLKFPRRSEPEALNKKKIA
jgi:biotin synthase